MSACSMRCVLMVNGLVNTFGSSMVMSKSMCPKSAPAIAFGDAQRLGLRVPGAVEPSLVVEAGGRHHQRVSLPFPDRVSHLRRIGILRQIPSIEEDGAVRAVGRLVQDHHQRGRLDQPCEVEELMVWEADRHALRERTVLPRFAHAPQEERLGPRLNVGRLEILRDVVAVQGPAPFQMPERSGLPSAVRALAQRGWVCRRAVVECPASGS